MNTRFILPATFALTAHAFVLFGLLGKPPPAPPAPEEPKPPKEDWVRLDNDEPVRAPNGDDPDTSAKPYPDAAPRPFDPPRWDSGKSDFIIIPIPPIQGRRDSRTIPVEWAVPRDGGNPLPGVTDWKLLDRVPRARLQPAPVYPLELRKSGVEGTVVVEFLVDETGNVYHAVILSATTAGFEEAALRAVAKWKFEPGRRGGLPVRSG